MNRISYLLCIALISLLLVITHPILQRDVASESGQIIQHDLKVMLYPNEKRFNAEDSVTLPESYTQQLHFILHKGLNPLSPTPGVRINREKEKTYNPQIETFTVVLPKGLGTFILTYGGSIYHPLESYGKEHARGFRQTPGIISDEGVYLSGSSLWYPVFNQGLLTFKLSITLPHGWDAVSQGKRILHDKTAELTTVCWESREPQEEIYIVAGRFKEYTKKTGNTSAMVFLRRPDSELSAKYLNATAKYISLYERLIGAYPYEKFALVENFWETGFGMPSFTLLGSKIIRFPFIINSSFPHEILHTWFGNSVFPDYTKGNWSEGLTAYLSDHLIKEQQGKGAEYRQETLQKYADYVLSDRDFPLSEFRTRHSSPSEAVGYGKSLMFFHMLRQELGDRTFTGGLHNFYEKHRFKFATFDDLQKSFEKASGKDLKVQFTQWITQVGAPEFRVSNTQTKAEGDGYVLTTRIEQIQPGKAYLLQIPFAVTMEGQKSAFQTVVYMDKKQIELQLRLPSRPLRFDVDLEFDVFRKLDRKEMPPALTQTLGAKKLLILLPSSADKKLSSAYGDLAQALMNSGPDDIEVKYDTEVKSLPTDCSVILLGWGNLFLQEIEESLFAYGVHITKGNLKIEGTEFKQGTLSVMVTVWNPKNKDMAITLVASDHSEALPGLVRKLPHYHKYSYLVFEGDEPRNIAKDRWRVLDSPMAVFLSDKNGGASKVEMGKLAPRKSLITDSPDFSSHRMMETITFLSSEELRGRGLGTEELDRAAVFIADKFHEAGLYPLGDSEGSYFQVWREEKGEIAMKNVIGIIPGKNPELKKEFVVIGAHYDHLGIRHPDVKEESGKIFYGANDNASGVAVLIELARVLRESLDPERSIVFVAFTGEESGKQGSQYYIERQRAHSLENCIGMVNLDTVGHLWKKKILVLGTDSAHEWIQILRRANTQTDVGVDIVSEDLDSSDQVSFHAAGIPAIQLFGGPHIDYHKPTDTVDRIEPEALLKVASLTSQIIKDLSIRKETLTFKKKLHEEVAQYPKKERKVRFGIIPDFSYHGNGCRVSGVVSGTPAEKAGLREGDVIIGINLNSVNCLKDLSNILKTLIPGNRISITFLRKGKELTVETMVVER